MFYNFIHVDLATFGGGVTGSTAHNPFLTEALLLASITEVEDEYAVMAPVTFDRRSRVRELIEMSSGH
jgi:hypothetical protein